MKAWLYSKELVDNAEVKIVPEIEEDWLQSDAVRLQEADMKIHWYSEAPGSGAPTSLLAGAVQSMENMGYDATEAEVILSRGLEALKVNDIGMLSKLTANLMQSLFRLPRNEDSPYWDYKVYNDFHSFIEDCHLEVIEDERQVTSQLYDTIYKSWLAQISAGAYGTALEGYTREQIKKKFDLIDDYIKPPSTYNDDITFEIAFLEACRKKGEKVTSLEIADEWIALIPFGWSAEGIALKNLNAGLTPPESGYFQNPYREWIGAQMRGAVCGLVAPGKPLLAAQLAWMDGEISHHNNGIIGEVFNALLVAMAFTQTDARKLLKMVIDFLPNDSEFKWSVMTALEFCKESQTAEEALIKCEKCFEMYNLVHAYPNAAIEVVALWFGESDFEKTITIAGLAGLDVDCNTAQLGSIVAILSDGKGLSEKWTSPIPEEIKTYLRGIPTLSIHEITKKTIEVMQQFL